MEIIEKIFYGKLCPFEEIAKTIPNFSEYSANILAKSEQLKQTLSEEQLAIFIEYDEILADFYRICEKRSFAGGFRLGAQISAEIFRDGK